MSLENLYDIKRAYSDKSYKLEEIQHSFKEFLKKASSDDDNLKLSVWKLVSEFADFGMVDFLTNELDWRANNITDGYSNVLHFLANKGDATYFNMPKGRVYETTKKLLDAKVSMLKKDGYNLTPLMGAAKNGMVEFIQVCIEKGVKIGITTEDGDTLLHLIAEYSGRAEESFEKYTTPEYEKEMSKEDFDATKKYMVERREYVTDKYNREKDTIRGFIDSAKLLMEQGLDPFEKNNYNKTAIDVAVNYKGKIISVVLQGIDVDSDDSKLQLQTAGMNIFQACEAKDSVALDAILQLGANPNEEQDDENSSENKMLALSIAMKYFDFPSIKILLENGASATIFDSRGKHPLTYMYHSGYIKSEAYKEKIPQKILALLVQKGFKLDDYIDDDENTLLTYTAKNFYYNTNLAKALLDELIYKNCDVNKSNKHGQSALMFLCASDDREAENSLITLLENGVDVSVKDKNGKTPLIYAAKNSNNTYAKNYAELLEQFGDILVSAKDNQGKSSLDLAVENNNEPLVKWLLERQ
ncbi:MAG: ankyrin repeat domain-containing protein [Campylobacteraceae bacterium]